MCNLVRGSCVMVNKVVSLISKLICGLSVCLEKRIYPECAVMCELYVDRITAI